MKWAGEPGGAAGRVITFLLLHEHVWPLSVEVESWVVTYLAGGLVNVRSDCARGSDDGTIILAAFGRGGTVFFFFFVWTGWLCVCVCVAVTD